LGCVGCLLLRGCGVRVSRVGGAWGARCWLVMTGVSSVVGLWWRRGRRAVTSCVAVVVRRVGVVGRTWVCWGVFNEAGSVEAVGAVADAVFAVWWADSLAVDIGRVVPGGESERCAARVDLSSGEREW